MSTRNCRASQAGEHDPAELVGLVVAAKRRTLLAVHRHRLRPDDLEECFAQAALELVQRARSGAAFANRAHVARLLEQRFLSRIQDRRRALGGRSTAQAELERALRAGAGEGEGLQAPDPCANVESHVLARQELELLTLLAARLTSDQRLTLATQIALQMDCGEFCRRFGWSHEKYRKVAQRGRARLRALLEGCSEPAEGSRGR